MKFNKKILLIDMDQVLVDMVPAWLRLYETISGDKVDFNEIYNYDFSRSVKYPKLLNSIIENPGFFRSLPPLPGAVDALKQVLKDDRYETIIVTQPPRKSDYAIKEKREWILDHIHDFDLENFIFAHKKYLIRGDLLFDDKPSHLKEWKMYNPSGKTAIMRYKYNQNEKADISLHPEDGWSSFYKAIQVVV
jgi:5'-nucleotidase